MRKTGSLKTTTFKRLSRISVPRPFEVPLHDLERYARLQEQQLWYNQHEHTMRIYGMKTCNRMQQCETNNEELIQKEQWEEIEFLLQQLK